MTTMRKTYLLSILLLCFFAQSFAQLRVYQNGNVNIGDSISSLACQLTVNELSSLKIPLNLYNSTKAGMASFLRPSESYNFGIVGSCIQPNGTLSTQNYGVYGIAGSSSSPGYNYGVFGCLLNMGNGTAVYGSTSNMFGTNLSGKYAAYFNGDAYVTGTATITTLLQPSDERLKEDISYLSDNREDIHSRMMDVDVISYRYKPFFFTNEDPDELEKNEEADRRIHYGVSAQQIQELFPDLVVEGQDGYLAVNYQELVPMLICSVQQLQREVEELKSEVEDYQGLESRKSPGQSQQEFRSDRKIKDGLPEKCRLYQNTPNPLTHQTVIRYDLPPTASDAFIYILNLQGKLIRQVPVDVAQNSISISCSELEAGMYIYSLVVSGQEVDTKKMIVAR